MNMEMMDWFKVLLIGVGALGLISLIWRLSSMRRSIPCPTWLSKLVEMDNPLVRVHHAASIVAAADVTPGMVVLDAGCGPGRVTIPLAKAVGKDGLVVAMDLQQEMLSKVRDTGLSPKF